ncbi:MAG: hypothetical protein V1495_04110 [Pseudomonadota bacterium]
MNRNVLSILVGVAFLLPGSPAWAQRTMEQVQREQDQERLRKFNEKEAREAPAKKKKKWENEPAYKFTVTAKSSNSKARFQITAHAGMYCYLRYPGKPTEITGQGITPQEKKGSLFSNGKVEILFTGKQMIDDVGGKDYYYDPGPTCKELMADHGVVITIANMNDLDKPVASAFVNLGELNQPEWQSFSRKDKATGTQFKIRAFDLR